MAVPTTAISRFDLGMSYTEFSLEANRRKFIGLKVLPPVGVSQESANFRRLNVESFLKKPETTQRAPRTGYARDTFTWAQDSYAVQEHGVEEVNDDAENEMYGDIVRGEQVSEAFDVLLDNLLGTWGDVVEVADIASYPLPFCFDANQNDGWFVYTGLSEKSETVFL